MGRSLKIEMGLHLKIHAIAIAPLATAEAATPRIPGRQQEEAAIQCFVEESRLCGRLNGSKKEQ
jgi:hypothetical protein